MTTDHQFAKRLYRLMSVIEQHGPNGMVERLDDAGRKEINALLRSLEEHLSDEDYEQSQTIVEHDKDMTLKDQHERVMQILRDNSIQPDPNEQPPRRGRPPTKNKNEDDDDDFDLSNLVG